MGSIPIMTPKFIFRKVYFMLIISGEKGTGKTRRLIEAAKEHNAIIACSDPAKMLERAHKYGITGITFCSYADLILDDCYSDKQVYIHDLNTFLTIACPAVSGFSICNN